MRQEVPNGLVARLRDILQLRFTSLFASFPPAVLATISPANPVRRIGRVVAYAVLRLLGHLFQPIRNHDDLHDKMWLYVVSPNNYDALQFIAQARADAVLVAGQGKQIGRYNKVVNRLSLRRKLVYYWQYPLVFLGLVRIEGQKALRFFDLIFYAIGYYEVYRLALRYYKPKAVVFANDHNDDTRALLLACRAESVPTAYVQHASVSSHFPPLGFNLNLLEGQDALDKYRKCGPIQGEVALVGMPKADDFLRQRNSKEAVHRVAFTTNLHDPLPALRETLTYLIAALPNLLFTLRPHPVDTRDYTSLRSALPTLAWSDAREEKIFDFLSRHDALVAADTSTHLEATLLNLVSLYFRLGTNATIDDYYGYVAHGLVDRADSLPALAKLLRSYEYYKPVDLYRRATYYNATLGTADEGHSQALCLRVLNEWAPIR